MRFWTCLLQAGARDETQDIIHKTQDTRRNLKGLVRMYQVPLTVPYSKIKASKIIQFLRSKPECFYIWSISFGNCKDSCNEFVPYRV